MKSNNNIHSGRGAFKYENLRFIGKVHVNI